MKKFQKILRPDTGLQETVPEVMITEGEFLNDSEESESDLVKSERDSGSEDSLQFDLTSVEIEPGIDIPLSDTQIITIKSCIKLIDYSKPTDLSYPRGYRCEIDGVGFSFWTVEFEGAEPERISLLELFTKSGKDSQFVTLKELKEMQGDMKQQFSEDLAKERAFYRQLTFLQTAAFIGILVVLGLGQARGFDVDSVFSLFQ